MFPPNSQGRKQRPVCTGLLDYFPDAIVAVSHVSFVGNEQHNPGEPLHWSREKSNDHPDCALRHLMQRGAYDDDGIRHSAKLAWRALAILQLEIESAFPTSSPPPPDHPEAPKPKSRPRVYIAGPMTGKPQFNFPAFDQARIDFEFLDYHAISPADIDRSMGIDPLRPGVEEMVAAYTAADWNKVIRRDVEVILSLDPKTDCVAVLEGWEKSKGAVAEVMLARWCGLNILRAFTGYPLLATHLKDADLIDSFSQYLNGPETP